ncbi:MAG: prenyltransferase/squalene oxidase repeat-containing protein [Planctomycetota bacterium]
MISAASRARLLLGDSADLVAGFVGRQLTSDGGFRGRTEKSDLYYTVFGIESLRALKAETDWEKIASYLEQFGSDEGLDFVHLCCLGRCWASVCEALGRPVDANLRDGILRKIAAFRSKDGGFNDSPATNHGTAYACFLALGLYQDLGAEIDNPEGLVECIATLRTPDGGYANSPAMQIGATPATAAAIAVLHYLGEDIDETCTKWLLAQAHPKGGFTATAAGGSFAIPDMLSTATAIHALSLAQAPLGDIRENCLDFLDSLWNSQGAFAGSWADPTLDCEYTYYGLLTLGHLGGVEDSTS